MARPVTVQTEQILEAARAEFLEKGYNKATTASIASRAGVSEGSLFKRFAGKAQLFCAAMDISIFELLATLPDRIGRGDVRDNLRQLILDLIRHLEQALPKIMMMWSQRALFENGHPPLDSPPLRILAALTDFFRREMQLGRMRVSDPEIVARLLMGASWNYCMLNIISTKRPAWSREDYAAAVLDQLWNGLALPSPVAPSAVRPVPARAAQGSRRSNHRDAHRRRSRRSA